MIPTAEEFLEKGDYHYYINDDGEKVFYESGVKRAMEDYANIKAKYHVEAALKAASEKAEAEPYSEGAVGQCGIDADSILNAYPLTNIK